MKSHSGCLIALEGIDRAGKSTILDLLPPLLGGCTVGIATCSERQSPLGCLLVPEKLADLSPFLKTYFFAADRAWVYERVCWPRLELGNMVIWDRYVASAIAYRSADLMPGTSLIDLEFVKKINEPFLVPDLTILIDISTATSSNRGRRAGTEEAYSAVQLERVREAYLTLAQRWPTVSVKGEQPAERVAAEAATSIRKTFPEFFHEA